MWVLEVELCIDKIEKIAIMKRKLLVHIQERKNTFGILLEAWALVMMIKYT